MAHPPVDQEVFWSVNWDDFEWVFHGRTVGEFTSTSWRVSTGTAYPETYLDFFLFTKIELAK